MGALAVLLLIVLLVLQVLDFHTTRTILAAGGKELNPIMRRAMDVVGVDEALLMKGAAVFALGCIFLFDYPVMLFLLDAFYVGVIVFNQRSMLK